MEIRSLANDIKFGLKNEEIILTSLKTYWNDETIRNTKDIYNDEYFPYDFENEKGCSWEVKSRRNSKTQYPTTILPVHKVRNTNEKQYFVFQFTDKNCFIEYDKEKFDTFRTRQIRVQRYGGNSNYYNHYEIPIELLIDF